jgi:hypothetical protein
MATEMEQSTISDSNDDGFPPEKRLEAPTYRLVEAGIATIPDMETLQECVTYENTHQNRTPVLKRLERKGAQLRDGVDEASRD